MRALNTLLALLFSIGLGLALFEFGLGRLPVFREQVRLNQFDAHLGWSKKPLQRGRRSSAEFNVLFETNERGLREAHATPERSAPGTLRVLLLGDSFVLGQTVAERDVFGTQLENLWRAEGRNIEVINAGTEGYSSDQEVLWFLQQGLDLQPDLVLIFPYENDIYWNGQTNYNGWPKPRFDPQGKLEDYALLNPELGSPWHMNWATGRWAQWLAHQFSAPSLDPALGFSSPTARGPLLKEFGILLKEPPAFVAACLQHTRGAMLALRDACHAASVPLFMVPIPSESCIHPEEREAFRTSAQGLRGLSDELWSPELPLEHFMRIAEELGIKALAVQDALLHRGAHERLYFEQEWHLNAAGNRVLAEQLHVELDRLRVLPSNLAREPSQAPHPVANNGNGIPGWLLLFLGLWVGLSASYRHAQPKESTLGVFLKVGLLLALITALLFAWNMLLEGFPRAAGPLIVTLVGLFGGILAWKLGRRLGSMLELYLCFLRRGHWYLMPLLAVLLALGSLLMVAASSPLMAPFIYTLF